MRRDFTRKPVSFPGQVPLRCCGILLNEVTHFLACVKACEERGDTKGASLMRGYVSAWITHRNKVGRT
jgi:hypothetical protein